MNKTDYDGIITKPSMEEVLYHGAFHKYLNKYMGKNGKWVYVYNKAAGAASGAMNKAKAALPGLQKQAMSTAVSTRNKVGSAVSSGSKQASALKKKAQNRISTMLPILSKKLKKRADGTYSNVKKAVTKKTKALKGAYYSGKSKGAEAAAKYKRKKKMKIGSYSLTTNGNRIGVNDDVRIFGAHNISSQSGRVGSRVNEGISAGRKRVAKKRKNKK